MAGNSRRSPFFIKAKTEKELQRLMLQMQMRDQKQYTYISIYREKDGVYAWFYRDNDPAELLNDIN